MATGKRTRPKMTLDAPADPPKPVGTASPPPPPPETPEKKVQRSRIGKRAVTFYLSDDAFRQLGVLSAQTDKSIQLLMTEAVDWVFQTHGLARIAKS